MVSYAIDFFTYVKINFDFYNPSLQIKILRIVKRARASLAFAFSQKLINIYK